MVSVDEPLSTSPRSRRSEAGFWVGAGATLQGPCVPPETWLSGNQTPVVVNVDLDSQSFMPVLYIVNQKQYRSRLRQLRSTLVHLIEGYVRMNHWHFGSLASVSTIAKIPSMICQEPEVARGMLVVGAAARRAAAVPETD